MHFKKFTGKSELHGTRHQFSLTEGNGGFIRRKTIGLCLSVILIFTITGCGKKNIEENTATDEVAVVEISESAETDENITSEATEEIETTTEIIPTTELEETKEVTEAPTEAPTVKPTDAPTQAPTVKPTEAPTQAPTVKPTEAPTQPPTVKPTEAPVQKTYDLNSAEYQEKAKKLIIDKMNEYRKSEGASNLVSSPDSLAWKFAQGRSKQITKNFAHDTDDTRNLAGQLKYGDYTDLSLYGVEGVEPYYEPFGTEAIGHVPAVATDSPEELAAFIARGLYNSKGHWRYLGAEKYKYCAVGLTKDVSWYVSIWVIRESED